MQTPALPLGYAALKLERETGLEPATFSLARRRSTSELLPPARLSLIIGGRHGREKPRGSRGWTHVFLTELEKLLVAEKEEPDHEKYDEHPDGVQCVLLFSRDRLGDPLPLRPGDEPPNQETDEQPCPPFHWLLPPPVSEVGPLFRYTQAKSS